MNCSVSQTHVRNIYQLLFHEKGFIHRAVQLNACLRMVKDAGAFEDRPFSGQSHVTSLEKFTLLAHF